MRDYQYIPSQTHRRTDRQTDRQTHSAHTCEGKNTLTNTADIIVSFNRNELLCIRASYRSRAASSLAVVNTPSQLRGGVDVKRDRMQWCVGLTVRTHKRAILFVYAGTYRVRASAVTVGARRSALVPLFGCSLWHSCGPQLLESHVERVSLGARGRVSARVDGKLLSIVNHNVEEPVAHASLGTAVLTGRVENDPNCIRARPHVARVLYDTRAALQPARALFPVDGPCHTSRLGRAQPTA